MTSPDDAATPFGAGSVSLRLYPHNELAATEIVDRLCTMAATAAEVGFDDRLHQGLVAGAVGARHAGAGRAPPCP